MLTEADSRRAAPAAAIGASSKLVQLLRKRLRQLLRVTLVLAICLVLAATGSAIWWLTSLNELPDIRDPFDVAAFRALCVTEDQNAFALLRRADEMLTPVPSSLEVTWAQANSKLREWVAANHRATGLTCLHQRRADENLPRFSRRNRTVIDTAP